MTWNKHASVTPGGKPHYYRLMDQGQWLASVVWNRQVRAYSVEVVKLIPHGIRTGRLVCYTSTVAAGKKAALEALRPSPQPPSLPAQDSQASV